MVWAYLVIAGIFEVGFATSLKLSENFHNWPFAVSLIAGAAISFRLLVAAVKHILLGTAYATYAIWTGIGACGTALVGVLLLGDPVTLGRTSFLVLLVGSVIGLKLASSDERKPVQAKEVL